MSGPSARPARRDPSPPGWRGPNRAASNTGRNHDPRRPQVSTLSEPSARGPPVVAVRRPTTCITQSPTPTRTSPTFTTATTATTTTSRTSASSRKRTVLRDRGEAPPQPALAQRSATSCEPTVSGDGAARRRDDGPAGSVPQRGVRDWPSDRLKDSAACRDGPVPVGVDLDQAGIAQRDLTLVAADLVDE